MLSRSRISRGMRPASTDIQRTRPIDAFSRRLTPKFLEFSQEVRHDDLPITSMDESRVAISWDTKTRTRFHHVWLRDHCRCPQCFHHITKQRLLNTFEIPPDIQPTNVRSKSGGLEITWPANAHVSLYPWSWLCRASYDPPIGSYELKTGPVLLGSKIEKSPPSVSYLDAISEDDRGLFELLSKVSKFGFCFVKGVPVTTEKTEKLCRRIGFIRETQYGKFWDFTSDLAMGDTAYTTLALSAHTDNTYFVRSLVLDKIRHWVTTLPQTDPAGLQIFHKLSHPNGSGGETLLVDGFYVASILKKLKPEAYRMLSTIPVPAKAAGEPHELYQPSPALGYPVLNHNRVTGELTQVRWNNHDRSVMSHLKPQQVLKWYDAIREWNKAITSADAEYWVQLTPGTVIVIDNHRVLHGRSAFQGERRMCGAYIGVDEFRSKLAVLNEKFNVADHSKEQNAGVAERSKWDPAL